MPALIGTRSALRAFRTPSLYLGQVATRCRIATVKDTGDLQLMVQTYHYARDDITALQIEVGGFYVPNPDSGENGFLANFPIKAGVAIDPTGAFTRIPWGGSATGSVTNGGKSRSDATAITIPKGTKFYIRQWWDGTAAGGVPLVPKANDTANGDLLAGGTTVADVSLGGTLTGGVTDYNLPPLSILAQTRLPSVYAIGDSRTSQSHDSYNTSGDLGEICRSIGPYFGYTNGGADGDTAQKWLALGTIRQALAANHSHAVVGFPINDLISGRTAAQALADLQSIHSVLQGYGLKVCQLTCSPHTPASAGSTSWTSTATQVAEPTVTPKIASLNASLRAGLPGITIFDTAAAVESSGKWIANYTDDGLHALPAGCIAIQNSGAINRALITR